MGRVRGVVERGAQGYGKDYGEVPAELQEKILNEKDMAVLKCWLKIAAKVNSVEEFEKESIIYSSR